MRQRCPWCTDMEPSNPILDELRAIRESIAEACDYDVQKIAEFFRARQNDDRGGVVALQPKRINDDEAPKTEAES
jgi:hypothetical protein